MGGFTERQKSELKSIYKDMSKDLIREIVNNTVFMEAIANKVAETITQTMEKHIDLLNTKIQILQDEMSDIKGENDELKKKIEDLEQASKSNRVRFHGIPENNQENLKANIESIIKTTLEVKNFVIEECYRTGKKLQNKPRAIIVQFGNLNQRNEVFLNKKKLKHTKIGITEDLIKSRFELLGLAREKLGKENVWSMGGRIFTKRGGRKINLKSEDEITNL